MSSSTQVRPGRDASTPPPPEPPATPVVAGLGPIGWARWVWRQLTSMRTALLLLLALAVGAVPGSIFPQTGIDPVKVSQYRSDHAVLSPWLDRLGAFDVYGSPWFAAIYLLLFISLVGCVLPRTRVHLRNLREPPPRTPARLDRLPEHRVLDLGTGSDRTGPADPTAPDLLAAARTALRKRGYRVAEHGGPSPSLAGQRGDLRETGNLVFHLALVGVLVSFAVSSLFGYRGQVVVPVGEAFVDALPTIDTIDTGALVDTDDLPPFRFTLKALHVRFDDSSAGNQFGAPRSFSADVDVVDAPGDRARAATIAVNDPLRVAGTSVYLAGNGYAPVIRVTDASGQVAFEQAVPFLVQDSHYTSSGVVKVSDTGGEQLGLQALFLPTASTQPGLAPVSTFPGPRNPRLSFFVWKGDLGLDGGVPQNVYELDTSAMTQVKAADGQRFSADLAPGQSAALPDGAGTVTFVGLQRYAGFTFGHDPGRTGALVFALLAIAGLTVSLFVPRRRVWLRVDGGRIELGALARSEDPGLAAEADAVLAAVAAAVAARAAPPADEHDPHDSGDDHDPHDSDDEHDHPRGSTR